MKHVWTQLDDTCRIVVRLTTGREGRGRSGEGLLMGRSEGMKPLGRREDNINVDPTETR